MWYMHKQDSFLENETHYIICVSIPTDHLSSARRPDLLIVTKKDKKKKQTNGGLWHTSNNRVKYKKGKNEITI